jgi:hypothetical protein
LPLDPTPVPTGPEFRIDVAAARVQFNPEAAALAGGGFVVVRNDSVQVVGGSRPVYTDGDIRAQLYSADGTPAGGEFLVNDYRTDHQGSPLVAALADGGFAVTWEASNGACQTLRTSTSGASPRTGRRPATKSASTMP